MLNYDNIKDAEVNVGLGPLHTQFDDKGFAYTSLFVESAVAKWKLGTWEVVDKIPISYNIGHLTAAEGDTKSPDGRYLVALNKLSHGRHLSVGPSQPEASQLIDIGGVTLLRAAGQNYLDVAIVCDPNDYPQVLRELEDHDEQQQSPCYASIDQWTR